MTGNGYTVIRIRNQAGSPFLTHFRFGLGRVWAGRVAAAAVGRCRPLTVG